MDETAVQSQPQTANQSSRENLHKTRDTSAEADHFKITTGTTASAALDTECTTPADATANQGGWSSRRSGNNFDSTASDANEEDRDSARGGFGFGGGGDFGDGNFGHFGGNFGNFGNSSGGRVYRGKALTQRIKHLGDKRKLTEVLRLVSRSPIPVTTNGRRITIGAVIGACCKCGDLDRGMRLLRQLDGPEGCGAGAPAYCALIQAHGRAGRLREALELLEAWEKGRGPMDGKIGVGRNGTIYVAGSLKWGKKDVPLRSTKWRDEMGVTWHAPRVAQSRMLLTVLDACASCGDTRRARKFKDTLLSWDGRVVDGRVAFDGVSDAEAAWNAVAKAHANSDDPLTALTVLREMETDPSNPVVPKQVSYNIALKACQRGGRPDWARALITRMREIAARTCDRNMYPDAVSYTTAARAEAAAARGFSGAEHAGGVESVDAMYAEVRGPLGPPPDPQCYGAIIDAFVAYGDVARALAAVSAAEMEPKMELPSRAYLGVMRAYATAGDVSGVSTLATRLETQLQRRAQRRERRGANRNTVSDDVSGDASSLKEDVSDASSLKDTLGSVSFFEPGVEAEVVMCQAEAFAAAGDAGGARAALERLKRLDYGASSKVLRDRSTELLVSLFVKDIVGRSGTTRDTISRDANSQPATSAATSAATLDYVLAVGDAFVDDTSTGDTTNTTTTSQQATSNSTNTNKSIQGITQALDLIDSAWGFASLDEDDEFLPSLDEDDIPVPNLGKGGGGFGGFLNGAVKRGGWVDVSQGPYPGGLDFTNKSDWTSPTLRSPEAADALELWTGAAVRLLAGDAEPLVFRNRIDPAKMFMDETAIGATIDEDDDCVIDFESGETCGGGGDSEDTETAPKSSPLPNRFVVRDDQDAGRAAAAVGRGVVAVVVDAFLHPVGTLLGSGDVSEIAKGVSVKDVMGPRPTTIEGDTATVGDVAIVCAACTLNEPVAVVDGEGRLRRVLRREDLLAPARERRNDPR